MCGDVVKPVVQLQAVVLFGPVVGHAPEDTAFAQLDWPQLVYKLQFCETGAFMCFKSIIFIAHRITIEISRLLGRRNADQA